AVTFTATVFTDFGTPTGTVLFVDKGNLRLGTATLSGNQAVFTTSALLPGTHSMTAQYVGDLNFAGSTSAALAQTVTSQPPDFSMATNSSSATVVAGQAATFNFTLTPNNGFIGAIGFSCSGQPAGVSCAFVPQTVAASGNGAPLTTALTISTTAGVASL